jgi:4-aminobutyrate aminotransferase
VNQKKEKSLEHMDPTTPGNPPGIALNNRTEGDINITSARQKWWNDHISEPTMKLLEKDARYFLHQSLSTPCLDVLESCEGPYLENLAGKSYLDFHGNNAHQVGFGHPHVVERLVEQMYKLPFSTRRFTNEPAIELAEKLAQLAPGNLKRVLFTPNGSSAIGIALKLARAVTGKFKVLSFWDSFHGASLDVISVGGEAQFTLHMGPLMPGVERVPPPVTYRGIFQDNEQKCLEYIDYVLSKEPGIGAFLAETIRNTDVQVPSNDFWKKVRHLCDQYGVLLILDEIPIAFGRTGKMFAFEHYGIEPDILCLGKGLGGGIMPMAAIIARDEYNRFGDISLGHYTYEKSPLGSVAALATLEVLEEEKILDKVTQDEQWMKESLKELQDRHYWIGDIRGIGLLWGIELVKNRETREKAVDEAEKVMYQCLGEGLSFKISAGNVIQLSPALTINREELATAIDIIDKSIQALKP